MLDNFIICVNAVVPSAIYLAIGIFLKLAGVASDQEVRRFTRMTFLALYPFMMFDNLYGKDLKGAFNPLLIVLAVGITAFEIAASWIFICRTQKNTHNRGAMIQALWRSNLVLMGLPIGINIFGTDCVAPIALIILVIVPFYNIMAVVVLEYFRGGKVNPVKLVKSVIINPIIVGAIVAMVAIALHIRLPEAVLQTVTSLNNATTPISMILLGASLKFSGIKEDRRLVSVCVVGKLLVFPIIGISLAVCFGLRGPELGGILMMTATPSALASFTMASSMGSNGRLAGEAVVFSTLISCFTIPVWLFMLMTTGMF